MPALQLYLLGAPRVARGSRGLALPTAKGVALLAYLALQAAPAPRERVQDLLWPDSSVQAGGKNLRNLLWNLRKELGDPVQTQDDRLALGEDVWVDARVFEQEAEALVASPTEVVEPPALDLVRGPFLDGLALDDAPDFEVWVTAERERLGRLYLRALAQLVEARQRAGDWRGVLQWAERALAFDSLQEPLYRARMEAHARLGERAAALHVYDLLRETLERELGVTPLPETDELREQISAARLVSSTGRAAELAPAPTPPQMQIPASGVPSPFVGRSAERAALDRELAAAQQRARVVLLTGEMGIGKSRLWREWSHPLRARVSLLETRAVQATSNLVLMPLFELLHSRVLAPVLYRPDSPVSETWLSEAARLVPDLRSAHPDLPLPLALPAGEERRRLFEAFTRVLLAVPARPLVLFVDDVHWADRATLDWLGYLVARLRQEPFLLVLAYRFEDEPPALTQLSASWTREGIVERLPLARLPEAETLTLVNLLRAAPDQVDGLLQASGGNPYFVIELVQSGGGREGAPVPPALAELVRARLERLPAMARQVAQAAAVLEPDFDVQALRRVSGRGEEETLDALDTLLGSNILSERDEAYGFSHPLVAAIIRDQLSGARRRFLHGRAAQALEAAAGGPRAQNAARISEHYTEAGDPAHAAEFADLAVDHALNLAQPSEAARLAARALALEPTPARHRKLGHALMQNGELAAAETAFQAALEGWIAAKDQQNAARGYFDLAELYFASGKFDLGGAQMRQGLAYLKHDDDPEAHALAHLMLGTSRVDTGDLGEASETQFREGLEIAQKHDLDGVAARAHFVLGNFYAERGELERAVESFVESAARAERAGDLYQQVIGHNNAAYHALLLGDLARATREVEAGLALAEKYSLRLPLQYLYSTRGEIALAQEEFEHAADWFTRGLTEAERNGNRQQAANYRMNLALAARGRGDLGPALAQLLEAQAEVAPLRATHLRAQIELWLAETYLARGETQLAAAALDRADTALAQGGRERLLAWARRLRESVADSSPGKPRRKKK